MPLLPNRDHKKRAQDSTSPEAPLPRRPPAPPDDLAGTLADLADGVHLCDLARRLRDPRTELRRLDHLCVGPELEQLPERLVEILEPDGEDPVPALQIARQMPQRELAGTDLHLDARTRCLERARPLLPVGGKVEVLRTFEALVPDADRDEARHAIDP